jgi:hypothetical protein
MEATRKNPARQHTGKVVALTHSNPPAEAQPAGGRTPSLPTTIGNARLPAWIESWADDPLVHMPDIPAEVFDTLPSLIAQARDDLASGNPAEVLTALSTLASRRGFPLPDDLTMELDVEIMASWPRDLWCQSFRAVYEQFSYRRLPEVPDFRQHIEADLAERRSRLDRLESLRLKLETARLRSVWDEESRARQKDRTARPG